jgi:hypothetical protein
VVHRLDAKIEGPPHPHFTNVKGQVEDIHGHYEKAGKLAESVLTHLVMNVKVEEVNEEWKRDEDEDDEARKSTSSTSEDDADDGHPHRYHHHTIDGTIIANVDHTQHLHEQKIKELPDHERIKKDVKREKKLVPQPLPVPRSDKNSHKHHHKIAQLVDDMHAVGNHDHALKFAADHHEERHSVDHHHHHLAHQVANGAISHISHDTHHDPSSGIHAIPSAHPAAVSHHLRRLSRDARDAAHAGQGAARDGAGSTKPVKRRVSLAPKWVLRNLERI